jgi:hypothetical protein
MTNGVWIAFKDNKIIGYVLTEEESIARVKHGEADYFVYHEFAYCKHCEGAIIPYLTIKEEE